jgi:RNA polymerase sigma-70 factor (ECF subfamily)
MAPTEATLAQWFDEHRPYLWGLCYRVTGSAADAEDVVQETFIRALEHAPAALAEPRRWLVKVAVNVARDLLRRRKRRSYVGTWLPTPVDTGGEGGAVLPSYEPTIDGRRTLEGRYDLMESVSLAFLQSLEALTPTQRAVLLLCDVFDYTAAETAAALDLKEGNVRTIHHRARREMDAYDRQRPASSPNRQRLTSRALKRFLDLLAENDVRGIERMLAADVRAVADGGGEFTATRVPLIGRAKVARFFARLRASRSGPGRVRFVEANGLPAAFVEFDHAMGRRPPRFLLAANVHENGLIANVWVVASRHKLGGCRT